MSWFAVFDDSSGRLLSVGSVLGGDLPIGASVVELKEEPNADEVVWDEPTRAFVPRPAVPAPVDLADAILAQPEVVGMGSITKANVELAVRRTLAQGG